jgi:hypothetical protein
LDLLNYSDDKTQVFAGVHDAKPTALEPVLKIQRLSIFSVLIINQKVRG